MLSINQGTLLFRKNQLLKNINLQFKPGHIYALVGSNGSGKTLILKSLCGLISLTEGSVMYNQNVLGQRFLQDCGIIIEKHDFIGYLTGMENMNHLARIKKIATKEDIAYFMTYFGLDPYDKRKVSVYSLGMKQKLSLVQAFMENPNILLLDEPTNALDEEYIEKFKALLLKAKSEGKIIIVSTHDKQLLNDIADEIITISEGEVKDSLLNPYIAS